MNQAVQTQEVAVQVLKVQGRDHDRKNFPVLVGSWLAYQSSTVVEPLWSKKNARNLQVAVVWKDLPCG